MPKHTPEESDQIVSRQAPRWAWELIDETLLMDIQASNFDPPLRDEIERATDAMTETHN